MPQPFTIVPKQPRNPPLCKSVLNQWADFPLRALISLVNAGGIEPHLQRKRAEPLKDKRAEQPLHGKHPLTQKLI